MSCLWGQTLNRTVILLVGAKDWVKCEMVSMANTLGSNSCIASNHGTVADLVYDTVTKCTYNNNDDLTKVEKGVGLNRLLAKTNTHAINLRQCIKLSWTAILFFIYCNGGTNKPFQCGHRRCGQLNVHLVSVCAAAVVLA